KRGLGDELVIAPYATALPPLLQAQESTEKFPPLEQAGARGDYGFFDAIDYTNRDPVGDDEPTRPGAWRRSVVHNYLAHHQGLTLVALGNALGGVRMWRRS